MGVLFKLCLLMSLCAYCEAQLRKDMSVIALIKAAGYPSEKHRVTTEDDYILQLERIPAGRRSARRSAQTNAKGKKAVLVVHGLTGYSGNFVVMGPERSLGFLLADAGYDVWLANLRGTEYSSHKKLKKSDQKFWDYSFHEHGQYDVPALIDKVLNVTKLEKIMYVGYSMGTTSYFVMLSEKPEYNRKLIAGVLMAPAVYMDNIKPVARFLLETIDFPMLLRQRGLFYISPILVKTLTSTFCPLKNPKRDICIAFINALVGEDNEQYDLELLPTCLDSFQPVTTGQLEHYGKVALTGSFTRWNGKLSSPVDPYNLTNVRVPTSMLYGENDQLTHKSQIMRLAEALNDTGALVSLRPGCSWPKFNHLDFVFAKDVGKLLNEPLVRHIDKLYNKYGLK